jgi:beta-1,4-N-acetylglucosaminyltransferase
MKICLVCSHGGHLTEMLELSEAFQGHDVFFVTYKSGRTKKLNRAYRFPNLTKDRLSLFSFVPRVLKILLKERPKAVVSTGAEIAVPVFYLAKLLGIKTIFVESCCRVERPSMTGRLVYPVTDKFFVQWPSLLAYYGQRARYAGSLL